jgi:hypothetical protein
LHQKYPETMVRKQTVSLEDSRETGKEHRTFSVWHQMDLPVQIFSPWMRMAWLRPWSLRVKLKIDQENKKRQKKRAHENSRHNTDPFFLA